MNAMRFAVHRSPRHAKDRGLARRRDHRRGSGQRLRRRRHGRDLLGASRPPRHLLPGPDVDPRTTGEVRAPLGRHPLLSAVGRDRRGTPRFSRSRRRRTRKRTSATSNCHTDQDVRAQARHGHDPLCPAGALEIGGDTMFCNQYMAYDALSGRTQGGCWPDCGRSAGARTSKAGETAARMRPADQHPGARASEPENDGSRAPGGAHASGDRAKGTFHGGGVKLQVRRHDRRGEQAAHRLPVRRARARSPCAGSGGTRSLAIGTTAARSISRSTTIPTRPV